MKATARLNAMMAGLLLAFLGIVIACDALVYLLLPDQIDLNFFGGVARDGVVSANRLRLAGASALFLSGLCLALLAARRGRRFK